MIPAGFVQALVDYAEAIDDVAPLKTERDALYAQVANGGKLTLVSTTLGGKSFGFANPNSLINMTVEEKFSAFSDAIKKYEGKAVPMTFASFGGLVR